MLRQIDSSLWVDEVPFKLLGIDFGNRMTCIQLSDQSLFLHSPNKFVASTENAVKNIGDIRYLVAPNAMHNLFIMKWKISNPQAQIFAPAGAKSLSADITLDEFKAQQISQFFGDEISCVPINGIPLLQEYAFIHHASKTLILTDLAFNFGSELSGWPKLFLTLYGGYNKFGPSITIRSLIRDKAAFARSLQSILSHDFTRIIVSHGHIAENNAKELFREAFKKYLSLAPAVIS